MLKISRFLRSGERNRLIRALGKWYGNLLAKLMGVELFFTSNENLYPNLKLDGLSKLFIYVKHGNVDKYDVEVVSFFTQASFEVIVFSDSKSNLFPSGTRIIHKRRVGRDLSVLRDVARSLVDTTQERLEFLFMNDSVVWKSERLPNILEAFRQVEKNTILFPTESLNPIRHVQPFFVYSSLDKVAAKSFATSFDWIFNFRFKRNLVRRVEYPMLNKLIDRGWSIRILVPYSKLMEYEIEVNKMNANGYPKPSLLYNPTQHFWRSLGILGLPIVKRSLINRNPVGIKGLPNSLEEALNQLC